MRVRVLLADDQPMVRAGFRMILEAEEGVRVVGEAGDGEEALEATRRLRPDVVLMDIQMPVLDGLEATRRLVADPSVQSRVVMLTTFEQDDYVFEALRAGASGFLLENGRPEDLVQAVRTVAAGDALLAPSVTPAADRGVRPAAAGAAPRRGAGAAHRARARGAPPAGHGQDQRRARGRAVPRRGTVKTHVSSVLGKLGLRDRVQAVVFAYESGLVEPRRG